MPRASAFHIAIAVSALFHLSMVSVFSIVILLPKPESRQFTIGLVQSPNPDHDRPLPADLYPNLLALADETVPDLLPPVELPRLASSLPVLRSPEDSLKIRSQFSELFEAREADTPDSWARFTSELRGIGPALSQWAWPRTDQPSPNRVRLECPAPGIALFVEWMSEPRERRALFVPPIASLWRLEPARLSTPIPVIFSVNERGKVEDVQTSVEDGAGVVTELRTVLPRFLFEPMENVHVQRGMLFVEAEGRP